MAYLLHRNSYIVMVYSSGIRYSNLLQIQLLCGHDSVATVSFIHHVKLRLELRQQRVQEIHSTQKQLYAWI